MSFQSKQYSALHSDSGSRVIIVALQGLLLKCVLEIPSHHQGISTVSSK